MIHAQFSKRFSELEAAFGNLTFRPAGMGSDTYVPDGQWRGWGTSVQHLLRAVFGEYSPHFLNFTESYKDCRGSGHEVPGLLSMFQAAKSDFDGGYVFNVDLRVSGEVFGNFVVLARQALSEGHKDVAAVLASAALEDALKRFAQVNGLEVTDKTMAEIVNALKGSGLVTGAQKSLLDAMPKLRNLAMHADWNKIDSADVSSMLGYAEQFLLSKFSGA
jgi:hypothetical protein